MVKRSPILGYNHNVRYRGLVFHVQTEDSGLLNPHLFTHLFHQGVIVSTRKLVYDAGANEEAIKALMQAQHKAVMKDLRRGSFDEKIDQYLGGTPGLEPRAGAAPAPMPRGERAVTEAAPPPEMESASPIEIVNEELSEPIELPIKRPGSPSIPGIPVPRTGTGDRTVPVDSMAPPPPEDDAPTLAGQQAHEVAAAVKAANQVSAPRTQTAERISSRTSTRDSGPIIEISVGDDDSDANRRGPRDTLAQDLVDGVPQRTGADSVPPQTIPVRQNPRPPSHGAATLPAVKPPPRPGTPPITARPVERREESGGVRVPEGERPGQYSVNRKDGSAPIREQTGRIATGQAPPGPRPKPGSGQVPPPAPPTQQRTAVQPVVAREPTPQHRVAPPAPPTAQRPPVPAAVQRPPTPTSLPPRGPVVARPATPSPTPSRTVTPPGGPNRVHVTAPITNRTPSPAPPSAGSGVVMTRPAVIVGAPPTKPPSAQTQTRIRRAREDEGRGFGQGLISEKSLDEVILAYLSEDAEDK